MINNCKDFENYFTSVYAKEVLNSLQLEYEDTKHKLKIIAKNKTTFNKLICCFIGIIDAYEKDRDKQVSILRDFN